jgi:acetolactate synthase-1/2/3 large subunit
MRYEPRIFGWNTPIEDMYPYLDRAEFRANMYIEPAPGWETPVMPSFTRAIE